MAVSNDEFDSAPEEVSLHASKTSILQTNKARHEAVRSLFTKSKEIRRRKDSRLKEQAKNKKAKLDHTLGGESSDDALEAKDLTNKPVKDLKTIALNTMGYVKVPKSKSLGTLEKDSIAASIADRKRRANCNVSRVSVSDSFHTHLYFKTATK